MTDFLLELRSEEIPARMQVKAKDDLARLFAEEIAKSGLTAGAIETFATPRRLALIARGLPAETSATSEERKGPRATAPEAALAGFLRSTGLTREQLSERDGTFFAVIERPGRPTADVLAEAIPAIVRAFAWPKSMRWGDASASTESLRWVRPLQGIVALFGETIVPFEIDGIVSSATTLGHRFHHSGPITIGSADDYAEKLRMCHVLVHLSERSRIIRDGAEAAAQAVGLTLVPDDGLVAENAGLTEWPVPLLGRFDAAFLDVPREVIQLTMRTNQKYFACVGADGALANAFVCTANIDASDGGAAIVAGNERVLAARLADAKFFWEADLKVPLADQAAKLGQIVFHEKLGTVADKVDRVAKLARWLVETKIVTPAKAGAHLPTDPLGATAEMGSRFRGNDDGIELAHLAETAARLCKADLVTGMVGEFPELQGIIGGHLALAQGLDPQIAAAIRDHYKPVGQGDDVPTDPVTVALSLADKLDTLLGFFLLREEPSGSRDPYALRRAAISANALIDRQKIRIPLFVTIANATLGYVETAVSWAERLKPGVQQQALDLSRWAEVRNFATEKSFFLDFPPAPTLDLNEAKAASALLAAVKFASADAMLVPIFRLVSFLADRLKVQQREAGVRHDLIDAVFALGGEDDLVRLLARVKALQAFVGTADGANLLAGYKRAANILRKEGWDATGTRHPELVSGSIAPQAPAEQAEEWMLKQVQHDGAQEKPLSYTPEPAEQSLVDALDLAEPLATAAIAREDFEAAMAALSSLRAPIDAFFEKVTVNDAEPPKRTARLALLARVRDAVHRVADFSKIEG